MSTVEDFGYEGAWSNRPFSLGELEVHIREYLTKLAGVHPSVSRWSIALRKAPWYQPLDASLGGLLEGLASYNFERKHIDWYRNLGSNGEFTAASTSLHGFDTRFVSLDADGRPR